MKSERHGEASVTRTKHFLTRSMFPTHLPIFATHASISPRFSDIFEHLCLFNFNSKPTSATWTPISPASFGRFLCQWKVLRNSSVEPLSPTREAPFRDAR